MPVASNSSLEIGLFEELDERKKLLVYRYVECFNYHKAGKSIGVSAGTAKKYLSEPLTRRFYQHVIDDEREISLINKSMVESYILDLVPMVMGEKKVACLSPKGEPFMAKVFNAQAAIRLGSEMQKHAGVEDGARGVAININFNNFGVDESTLNSTIIAEYTEIKDASAPED